jgi:PAS domain S-box-containing protein
MPELRESGIDILGKISWGTHFCSFYETKTDLLDTLVPYFKTGLENNEFCLWIISNSGLINIEEAREALKKAVPSLGQSISESNIEIFNETDWYLEHNKFNFEKVINSWRVKLNNALVRGYDGIRISGDTFWLGKKYQKDFSLYEKQLNDFITDLPVIILCTYPLAKSGAAEILDVAHSHQFAIARRKGKWEVIETSVQTQAQAEIKRLNKTLQGKKLRTTKSSETIGYTVAVLSVALALIAAKFLDVHLVTAPVSLFLCAVMFSAWYGGLKPGLLAVTLSLLAFNFFFVTPVYSFVLDLKEIPRIIIFTLAALFVVLLSSVQKNKAEAITRARNILDWTVQKLKQTNESMQKTITERKWAEDELRLAYQRLSYHFENTPLAVIELDKDLFVKRWSKRAEEIFGWKESEALGKNVYDPDFQIIFTDDIPQVDIINKELMKGSVNRNLSLNRNYTKSGQVIFCEWYNSVLKDEKGNVITILSLVHNVTERKKSEETLHQSYEEIRKLTEHLQKIREEERTYIAREIHDELGQQLTAIKMDVAWIDKNTPEELTNIKRKLENIIGLLDGSNQSIRRILSELRPGVLDDHGLLEAVEWLGRQFSETTGIPVRFTAPEKDIKVAEQIATCIFRLCQEALTNITRYSHAKNVSNTINIIDENIAVIIEDDGIGFDAALVQNKKSFGILGMKERVLSLGGTFELITSPGKGTKIIVNLPYKIE